MITKSLGWIASSLLAGTLVAQGKPIVENTFKDDLGAWVATGPSAKIVVYHDPALGAPTTGALRLNYGIGQPGFDALILPTSSEMLTPAKSVKFWIRTDLTTLVAVMLQEEEGGRYLALVHAPKDAWQPVELSIGDFALATDVNDPKDPNAKLDLDRVGGIVVADVSQFFAQADGAAAGLFDIKKGPHTLYLDDFTVSAAPIAQSTVSEGENVRIDSFVHPQLAWFGLGGAKLTRVTGAPLGGVGLKAEYRQAPGRPMVLTRPVLPWVLTQAKSITFDAASAQATKVMVQLEETGGGKYNALVDLPAGSAVKHVGLALSDFKPSEDSKDANGKLDPGSVKTINIIDFTGMTETSERENTLWIGNLIGVAKS